MFGTHTNNLGYPLALKAPPLHACNPHAALGALVARSAQAVRPQTIVTEAMLAGQRCVGHCDISSAADEAGL